MLEPRSALAAVYAPGRIGAIEVTAGVAVHERLRRTLVQVSGWQDSFAALCRTLEATCGMAMPEGFARAVSANERSVFRVAPERLWLAGAATDAVLRCLDEAALGGQGVVTDIAASRTVIRVLGPNAGELLNRGLPVDLDLARFPAESFAQSAIDHMPVLVHRVSMDRGVAFDVYVTSDYAVSFWQWLTEAAQSFGCEIRNAE